MSNEADSVKRFVSGRIYALENSSNEAAVRAKLAKLRRGIGRAPGSMPELWDITLDGLDECLMSNDGTPTRGEWAVYTALTLYALHQQSKDIKRERMNIKGVSLGAALRRLVRDDEDDARVKRRFDAALTSESMEELAHHLRGLVQLLKSEDIPLDYAAFAQELFFFQFDGARDRVRLKWGQDFYRYNKANEKSIESN